MAGLHWSDRIFSGFREPANRVYEPCDQIPETARQHVVWFNIIIIRIIIIFWPWYSISREEKIVLWEGKNENKLGWSLLLLLSQNYHSRPWSKGWPHHGRTFSMYLCHSDWLFHGESCPRLDVVHPGRVWSSSPACTWHCTLHYLFLLATTMLWLSQRTKNVLLLFITITFALHVDKLLFA